MDDEAAHALLTGLAAEHRVPGAQLVVRAPGGTAVAAVGTGPFTHETAVPLGSLTKPFTATLAMMLVADGEVDPDAPVTEYLREPVPPVTLRQLLGHLAGLPSDVAEHTTGTVSRSRWVTRYCGPDTLAHPPGTVFSYSNAGYLLAAHLVEVITAMSWHEAVSAVLLEPLGITPSFVAGPATARPATAGHTVTADHVLPVADQSLPELEAPAGALALSAADLVTFARLHWADPGLPRLLEPEAAQAMRADGTASIEAGPFGLADGWGPGWALYRHAGRTWYGHDGTGTGTSCHLRFEPASGTAVGFTTTAGTGLAMWADVVEALRAAGVPVGSYSLSTLPRAGRPAGASPGCEGRYINGESEFTVVGDPGGGLRMLVDGTPYADLTCFDDRCFTLRELAGESVYIGRFLGGPPAGRAECVQAIGRVARRCG